MESLVQNQKVLLGTKKRDDINLKLIQAEMLAVTQLYFVLTSNLLQVVSQHCRLIKATYLIRLGHCENRLNVRIDGLFILLFAGWDKQNRFD